MFLSVPRAAPKNPSEAATPCVPAGVAGASVFSHVGATAPTAEDDWTFEGLTGRTTVTITFPAETAPGATAWFRAAWYNPRGQKGPAATPATTNIAGGAAMAA